MVREDRVAHGTETAQLAAYLRMLKDRTGRSFDALGRRAGVSGSSLHRYCAGSTVPASFGSLLAFGKACGATRDELRDLQRLWVLADARRDQSRALPEQSDPPEPEQPPERPEPPAEPPATSAEPPERPQPAASAVPVAQQPQQPAALAVGDGTGAVEAGGCPRPRPRRRIWVALLAAVGAAAVLLGVSAATLVASRETGRSRPSTSSGDGRLLFSAACAQTVGQGQNDECVREVQRLLKAAGGRLAVDGSFGPETLRRVTVFQVLAKLPARGVVDDATKRALYDRKVSMRTWPEADVERRIREVFVEDPDRAVAIADCQSYLDPQWVQPNTNGTRNWGVFQISEYRLLQFKASPLQALDPEWNIQAAYRLWKLRPDFGDWPSCARAAGIPQSPSVAAAPG